MTCICDALSSHYAHIYKPSGLYRTEMYCLEHQFTIPHPRIDAKGLSTWSH